MKALIIIGSAKIDGNTEKLCRSFAEGLREEGCQSEFFHLGDKKVGGCRGCNACRKLGSCVIKDDFAGFLEKFTETDVIVFATPLYFWGISSQLKALIDRFYSIGIKSPKGYFSYPEKKVLLLATAADSDNHFWSFELVEQYYRRLVKYLHWEDLGMLLAGNCGGSVVERCIEKTEWLDKAFSFGRTTGKNLSMNSSDR